MGDREGRLLVEWNLLHLGQKYAPESTRADEKYHSCLSQRMTTKVQVLSALSPKLEGYSTVIIHSTIVAFH